MNITDLLETLQLQVVSIEECNIRWNKDKDRESFDRLVRDCFFKQNGSIYMPSIRVFGHEMYNYTFTVVEDKENNGVIDFLYVTIPIYFWTYDGCLLHVFLKLKCEFDEYITVADFNNSIESIKLIIHKNVQKPFSDYRCSFHKFLYDLASSLKYYDLT